MTAPRTACASVSKSIGTLPEPRKMISHAFFRRHLSKFFDWRPSHYPVLKYTWRNQTTDRTFIAAEVDACDEASVQATIGHDLAHPRRPLGRSSTARAPEKPPNTPGRPVVPFRQVMDGILYVLRTGCQWKALPREYGSGST